MSFLAPWYIPVLAALATVPPLVLLYFLKLKRQRMPIASTLLWRKAIEDLRVNSPFQRLRSSLLLFLQLLILAAACIAIAEPFKSAGRTFEKAIVLLIDQSASMATVEEGGETRLDLAKREAASVIEGLTSDQRAMLIAFADRARVLAPFTADKNALRRAVDSIQQTDAAGKLTEAVALAEAHSTPQGEDIGVYQAISQAHVIMFTDGRLSDADNVTVQRSTIELVRIGKATENVGIVNLDVRRSYEQPTSVTVLARVRNFGANKARADVSLYVDGQLKDVQSLGELAPAGSAERVVRMRPGGMPAEGSEAVVPFDLVLETGANVEVRLSGSDAFSADDRAFAVITPPQPMKILLVTSGNRYLRRMIEVMPVDSFEVWTPADYQDKPDAELIDSGRCIYDVVVLDNHSTDRLPPGNYFFFGGVPLIDGVEQGEFREGEVLLDWDDTHPILQHTTVESIRLVGWYDLKVPPEAFTLIEGTTGPVLSFFGRDRNQYLISAFTIFNDERTALNTDWIFKDESVSFMYDALRFLAGSTTVGQQPPVVPGEAFTVPVAPGIRSATLRRPDHTTESVPVNALGLASYGRTDKIGFYSVATGIENEGIRAVSLLNNAESLIAPDHDFRMGGSDVQLTGGSELNRRPLWPYFLMALGGILMVEWLVYNKRVYV